MKEIITTIIFLVPYRCVEQETELEKDSFSIGLNFSPNYSYRTLSYEEQYDGFVETQ